MIRAANEDELRLARSSWARSWNLRGHELQHGAFPWGAQRSVSPGLVRRMHASLVAETATSENVLAYVVDAPNGPEALAWCCRELVRRDGRPGFVALHFVYTVRGARSRGLALALLRYVRAEADTVGVPIRPTHSNPAGRALLAKLSHDQQRTDPPVQASAS